MPWRALDGSTALAIANVDEASRIFRFEIPFRDWQLPSEVKILKITTSSDIELGSFSIDLPNCEVNLTGLEVCVLEFK